jgi:hypothetical protein
VLAHGPRQVSSQLKTTLGWPSKGKQVILGWVTQYRFTEYFDKEVLRKRPYLKKEWCIQVLESPLKIEPQEGNRYRFWGKIEEFEGRILRVITLEDKVTIHNAFPDRGFTR